MKREKRTMISRRLKEMNKNTGKYAVLKYLCDNGSITSIQAFDDLRPKRVTRLSAVIYDLKNEEGIEIFDEWVTTKAKGISTTYKRYFL